MKLLNLLSFIGFVMFILALIASNAKGLDYDKWSDLSLPMQALMLWAIFGFLILWINMIVDNLKREAESGRAFWGLFLIFGSTLATVLYYIFIYLRRR